MSGLRFDAVLQRGRIACLFALRRQAAAGLAQAGEWSGTPGIPTITGGGKQESLNQVDRSNHCAPLH